MKKIQFFALVCLAFIGCNSEKEVAQMPSNSKDFEKLVTNNIQLQKARNKPYQLVSPAAKAYIAPGEKVPNIAANNDFVASSGLPNSVNFYNYSLKNDINQSLALYRSFIRENVKSNYLPFFKQYESWLLITHYDLLSQPNNAAAVKFLINESILANYQGFAFAYYCLQYLADNKAITPKELETFHAILLKNTSIAKKKTPLMDVNSKFDNGKPLPPAAIELINKHLEEKNESLLWLEKIKNIQIGA